ncbi:MAG: twin-arginine translocase TatA/TatE family subunit [Alistipes sp.]
MNFHPLFLGKIGASEIILLIVIVIIFFGGRKIPELMRGVGRGVKEFKDAMNKDYSAEEPKSESKEKSDKPEENK